MIKENLISDEIDIKQIENLLNEEDYFAVYPNPANNNLVNICTNETENSTIEIYNSIGAKIYQTSVNTTITEISTVNFKAGIYFIQLKRENNISKTVKLVVE